MAYYFGVNSGAPAIGAVAEGGTSTGKDVEIVIKTNASVPTTHELLLALRKLQDYIVSAPKNW